MKKFLIFLSVGLCAAFLLFFAAFLLLRNPDAYSVSERRQLAQTPEISVNGVLSGKTMGEIENYYTDQFPLRERFRSLKAYVSINLLRQKDNNDVYASNNYLAKLDPYLDENSVENAAQKFNYLYENYLKDSGSTVYLSVVPDKNFYLSETAGVPAYDECLLVNHLAEKMSYAKYIDLYSRLSIENYYRTDSHWKQESLLPVAQYLAGEMGISLAADYQEHLIDQPYFGVYYGYTPLHTEADRICYLDSDVLQNCTVINLENGEQIPVYSVEKAYGRDPYELFLSGSLSLIQIVNPSSDSGKELIVFRDSFGSSLVPLLAEAYEKITLVDIRYLPSAFLGRFMDFHGQDVLFLYNSTVINHSITLK